ncbi:hypothetical protein [Algibacter pacificus]|uniref:hypothetical protein n=1 Tax=Algibacter pacificus TaxID=2599389 RepID=UPI0011CA4D63|nr:hypothetical protein [Algibacter pacificus]
MILKKMDFKKLAFSMLLIGSCMLSACQDKAISDQEHDVEIPEEDVVSGSLEFKQMGPVGGGYPNVVTWDPNVPGKIYYGADIGGTGLSIDYGKNFESAARGLGYKDSHQKIAALNAIDVNGNTIIVGGTGFKGQGGGVISSSNGGDSWVEDSSNISFSAQNSDGPLPKRRPRSTDHSLIQWVGGSTWVAGTYKEGVWISNNNRSSWNKLNVFNGPVYVRSMAMSPIDANSVYVGLWGNASMTNKGLWCISKLNTSKPEAVKVLEVPDVVESITVLGHRLYLACGKFGLRKFVPSNNSLSNITGSIGTSVMATAIDGVQRTSDTDRIVVGTGHGSGDIWISEDSGMSWTNTTNSGVSKNPWGSNKNLIVFDKHANWALGGTKCDVASIQVSPHNPDAWVVCSTSAIWTTDDAGITWRPANGFQILTYRDVEINQAGIIAVGNVDHDILLSNDGGIHWVSKGFDKVTTGHGLKFSPNGSELAIAVNERDNNTKKGLLGSISSLGTNSPVVTEINNTTSPKRIIGLSWVILPDLTERIIAAVDNGGIRTVDRKDGNWTAMTTRTTSFMGPQSNNGLRCSVVTNGTSTTFVYDRMSGVWRTTDYGITWTQVLTTKAGKDQGYLAYDGGKDILYISTPNQVLRVNNASSSNMVNNLSFPVSNPGPLDLDPKGRLIVYAKPLNADYSDCVLYRNNTPEHNDGFWFDIADDTFKRVAPLVTDLSASNNYLVLVSSGKGILVSPNN